MPIQGRCHCGRIAFTFDAAPTEAIECNCSICRMRGSVLAAMEPSAFRLETPRDDIATYTFNTHSIQHHFCPACGVAPFAEGSDANGGAMVVVNLRCAEVDLDSIQRIPFDGASM